LPRKLYLLSSQDGSLRVLVNGLRAEAAPAWSPDSRWLAARLDFGRGQEGLWLVEVATGKRHLVLAGEQVGDAAWSADGRRLVAPAGIDAHGRNPRVPRGLYVIDLPDLTQLATRAAT
jgi:dipeptidyl aminopeptidase/acylaminoacyl peptidase